MSQTLEEPVPLLLETRRDRTTPENPARPKLRVALVNPPDPAADLDSRVGPPMGLGYVAAMARMHGHEADIFDLVAGMGMDTMGLCAAGLLDNYDVYGFGTYTESFVETMRILNCIRMVNPGARFVLGGYHATILWEDVLRDYPEVDVIVLNEGEYTFADLLDGWYAGRREAGGPGLAYRDDDGRPVRGEGCAPVIDQDELRYPVITPAYQTAAYLPHVDLRRRQLRTVLNMVSSRGCPKRCTFCAIIVMSPKWRARTVDSLMREIRCRYAGEPFRHISFQDANFFVDTRRTLAFSKALHEFNPDITWSGTATADHIIRHAAVLREISQLNCAYLEVGIESGNDRSLGRFNKWTTAEVNSRVLGLLADARLPIGLDFIMFEPDGALEDIAENFRFVKENELSGYWPPSVLFNSLKLYPGTPIRDKYALAHPDVKLPLHTIPLVGFDDSRIAALAAALDIYWQEVQGRTNRIAQELYRVTAAILDLARSAQGAPELARSLQQGFRWLIRLQHLPYQLFEFVLGHQEILVHGKTGREILECAAVNSHIAAQDGAQRCLSEILKELRAAGSKRATGNARTR